MTCASMPSGRAACQRCASDVKEQAPESNPKLREKAAMCPSHAQHPNPCQGVPGTEARMDPGEFLRFAIFIAHMRNNIASGLRGLQGLHSRFILRGHSPKLRIAQLFSKSCAMRNFGGWGIGITGSVAPGPVWLGTVRIRVGSLRRLRRMRPSSPSTAPKKATAQQLATAKSSGGLHNIEQVQPMSFGRQHCNAQHGAV
ncbi:hypothetical protein M569_04288, partial [Genlisea aurea]